MEQYRDRLIRVASRILRAGNPLPVTLQAKLDDAGILISELESALAQN